MSINFKKNLNIIQNFSQSIEKSVLFKIDKTDTFSHKLMLTRQLDFLYVRNLFILIFFLLNKHTFSLKNAKYHYKQISS